MQILRQRGAEWFGYITLAIALVLLSSCTPKIRIDLLNESGVSVQIVDRSKAQETTTIVPNSGRALLRGSNPLIIRDGEMERSYSLNELPEGFVRTTAKGLVLSVVLSADWKLYLLQPKEKPPTSKVAPQPLPFPVSPFP